MLRNVNFIFFIALLSTCQINCKKNSVEPKFPNKPPIITNVIALPDSVHWGENCELSVEATDPDNDPLTFLWKCNAGSFLTSAEKMNVIWKAPEQNLEVICTVNVHDGDEFTSDTVSINVSASLKDLLTKDNEISGWQRTEEHWTAKSSEDLYNYINGEGEIYTSRGFVEAVKQEYQGKVLDHTETVELRIFDQGKPANAKLVFDEVVSQMGNPIDWVSGAGKEAKIETYLFSQRLIFWRSKYYITLTITSKLDEALDVLKMFANNVDSEI